ncbi:MAG TPA: Ig-like domain-containing protein [Candidatus Binataceae bacterium]|nr:Ig-like domain-containing protein [Candidatus Binataceae bacterium]
MPINRKIAVSFSQAMDPTTITTTTFTVTGPGVTPVTGTVTYDPTNNSAIFAPTGLLPVSTTFTGTITTGAKSAAEVPLASDFVWTFTTSADSDTTAPTVISTNPADLAVSVATNKKVAATFSEGMDSTTITGSTFTVTGPGSTPVAGTVTYSIVGATATFTPTSALAAGVLFTATITTGVEDLAGNPLAAAFTWTFTTGAGPDGTVPAVTSTTPADTATSVAPNAGINATFSKAMDPSTLNPATFTLTGPGPTSIAGKITYDATDRIATFTPTSALASSSVFTATVTTGADDLEGNGLAADFSWSFTTGSTASLSSVDLGAASGFAVFAQASVTNANATVLDGDLGLTPGTSVTGFPPGTVNGTIQINTAPAVAALASLTTAYGDAAGRTGPTIVAENLAGLVLPPGLYTSAATSFEITGGNLTLDAQGDANAVWIFQMPASTLTLTSPTCNVILANGAQFSNVFWQVGSSATVGAGCAMAGNILADTSITLDSGAIVRGRALGGAVTLTGAVTLDANSVSAAGACNQ